ncbi:MAG: glutathione S-transferase family protein [Pseudomonadota bacterium]
MSHDITLYGFGTTRSARCQWTLLELGVEFKFIERSGLIGSDELRAFHPQAKLPAAIVNGDAIFESTAICNYFCDLYPEKDLIPRPGTVRRAQHDQWCAFNLSEMEAYLWSNAKHQSFYPEEKRVAEVVAPNTEEFRAGAKVIDELLGEQTYLLGNEFSVTDIVVSWTLNWGRRMNVIDGFDNIPTYLGNLFAREHCTLNQE